MALPKQIRKQIKQAEEIETYIRGTEENPNPVDVANKAAQDEIDNLLSEVDPKEKPTADVTELHPKPEGGDPEPAPEVKPERTDWKQKYAVLKGKYDAEVPRMAQDLRDSNSRITSLEDKLAGLATQAVVEDPAVVPLRTDFTPEEIADYGEDLMDVMGRKAREIVETEYRPQINSLQGEVAKLSTQIGETGQKVGKFETNEVFAQLDAEVKDWRAVNVDPEFHEWLDQLDPFSGITRKDLMLKAFNRKNAHQVKAFFTTYAQENAAVVPPSADPSLSGQGSTTTGSTLDLEKYVAPGTPRSGGDAGAPKEKRIWTHQEIGAFYGAVQKGHYRSRPDDKARIEADIVAATTQGRIK